MSNARGLRDRLERVLAEVGQLERAIARVEARPAEPYENGTVIRFSLLMPTSGMYNSGKKRYDFSAIRTNGRWFTTGRSGPANGRRWDELLDYFDQHELVDGFIEVWEPVLVAVLNGERRVQESPAPIRYIRVGDES